MTVINIINTLYITKEVFISDMSETMNRGTYMKTTPKYSVVFTESVQKGIVIYDGSADKSYEQVDRAVTILMETKVIM